MSVEAGKASSDSDVKEHFFRRFKHEETLLQEQMTRLKETTLQPAERASTTNQCLASIAQLSSELMEASAYLPAYDQRTYSTAIRSLNENLQEIRNASAPKRKFAFKKTVAQKDPTTSGRGASEDLTVQKQAATGDSAKIASSNKLDHHSGGPKGNQDSLDAGPVSEVTGAITITSLSSTYHRLNSASSELGSSISLANIQHSAVDLSDSISRPFATLAINSVTESLLICGRTSGAAHITGVENSTLIVWSRQLRMHECKKCLVYLRCSSRPIIEDCKGIRFTPFPPVYDTTASPGHVSPNLWDQVDDFKWLRAEHSPNWNTLQAGDEGAIESGPWEDIMSFGSSGCTLSELDDLLRAAKVT